jgi:hypothetical protein
MASNIEVGAAVRILPAARGWSPYAGMTGTVVEVTAYGDVLVALNEAKGSTLYTRLSQLVTI